MTDYPEALVERVAAMIWEQPGYRVPFSELNSMDRVRHFAKARAALDASPLRELADAASAFEGDLSEYCDGLARDRLRAVLARIKGGPLS